MIHRNKKKKNTSKGKQIKGTKRTNLTEQFSKSWKSSWCQQRPPVNVRPSRGQFSIEPPFFPHSASNRALSNLSIQRMPKTRRGIQRHAVGSDCLPLAAELTRGGTREKPRQKSSCNAV